MPVNREFSLQFAKGWRDDAGIGEENMIYEFIDNALDAIRDIFNSPKKILLKIINKNNDTFDLIFADNGHGMYSIHRQYLEGDKKKQSKIGRKNEGGLNSLLGLNPENVAIVSKNLARKSDDVNYGKYNGIFLNTKNFMNKIEKVEHKNYSDAQYDEDCNGGSFKNENKEDIPNKFIVDDTELDEYNTIFRLIFNKKDYDKVLNIFKTSTKKIPCLYNLPNMRYELSDYSCYITSKITDKNKNNKFMDLNIVDNYPSLSIIVSIYKNNNTENNYIAKFCIFSNNKLLLERYIIKGKGGVNNIYNKADLQEYTYIGKFTIKIYVFGSKGLETLKKTYKLKLYKQDICMFLNLLEKRISKTSHYNDSVSAHSIEIDIDNDLLNHPTYVEEQFHITTVKNNSTLDFKDIPLCLINKIIKRSDSLIKEIGQYNKEIGKRPWSKEDIASEGIQDWTPYRPFIQYIFRSSQGLSKDEKKKSKESPLPPWIKDSNNESVEEEKKEEYEEDDEGEGKKEEYEEDDEDESEGEEKSEDDNEGEGRKEEYEEDDEDESEGEEESEEESEDEEDNEGEGRKEEYEEDDEDEEDNEGKGRKEEYEEEGKGRKEEYEEEGKVELVQNITSVEQPVKAHIRHHYPKYSNEEEFNHLKKLFEDFENKDFENKKKEPKISEFLAEPSECHKEFSIVYSKLYSILNRI